MSVLLVVVAVALLGFVVWSRLGRSEGARWWVGDRFQESAILFWLPGIALVLGATAGLRGYDDGAHQGALAFVPLLLVGLVVSLWGGLFLPAPRWYVPRWSREARAPHLQVRIIGDRRRSDRKKRR
ncbi:hypothetical protein [Terrabacter aerolatus]|uniref:hypothetical protein n=1 Tax=Terrabacter aerolatus TaxID=422442 RepID=UPI0011BD7C88|nr:hypothetical protein [Terrabacter aerolatus]